MWDFLKLNCPNQSKYLEVIYNIGNHLGTFLALLVINIIRESYCNTWYDLYLVKALKTDLVCIVSLFLD